MYEWHGFGGGMMWIFWLLIIAALVFGVLLMTQRGSTFGRDDKSAIDMLNKRYARGEIDSDEYERINNDIKK